jgi:purine-binding chemotaxis protein CheW
MQNETLYPNAGLPLAGAPPPASIDENQLVTFLLENEEFGFNIMSVQEIIRLPRMAKVPRTPAYVDGIANLRGVVLPVIDMRTRFGMSRIEESDRTRVLVVDIDGVKAGLRVDHVKQVTRVRQEELEPPPTAIQGTSSDCLDGVVKLDQGKRIVMALNAARVCHIEVDRPSVGDHPGAFDRSGKATDSAASGGHSETEQQQLVTFRIAKEEFAFPLEHVQEILRVQAPSQVPGAPPYVLGVLTVRGKLLPVIDLRRLLEKKALAEEIAAACADLRKEYAAWLDQLAAHLASGSQNRINAPVTDRVRQWLDETNSSSQVLMEALATARGLNERVLKQLHSCAKADLAGAGLTARECGEQALAIGREMVASLARFEEQVAVSIHEDQRIIVLDAGGFSLGLVVDHVHEVLNVPKSLLEPPPQIAASTGMELAGVAKLDGGARLILLLAVSDLVGGERLRSIQQLAAKKSGEENGEAMQTSNKTDQGRAELQLVTFMLGEEEYGIPIAQVQEIDRLTKITKVPKAAPFIEGITNLRGEVVPVLDTRKRFDLEVKEPDDRTRLIIVDLGGVKTGLVVDSVRQVLNLSHKCISPPPEAIGSGSHQQFLSGVGSVDGGRRMIVLLDVEKILSQQEQASLEELAA